MNTFHKFVILTAILLFGIGLGLGAGAELHLFSENDFQIFSGNHLLSDNTASYSSNVSDSYNDGWLTLLAFGVLAWVLITVVFPKREG
jgi:hypothetical protein